MISHRNLYPRVCELANLYEAERKARRRKSRKIYVEDFRLHRERFLAQLQDELTSGAYRPRGYRQFQITDPKHRLISAAPYRDRVVHHALCNVIEPILSRRFVADSYSCQVGKGTSAARERCRCYTNRYRYVLKCDVRKFFQSIDHQILIAKLSRILACERTMALCAAILDSSSDDAIAPVFFLGDDLFTPFARKRGLPIGNLTSQIWANFYLDRLDHLIKETWRIRGFVRYTDDWLIWADDKAVLWDLRERVVEELAVERLALNADKTRVLTTREGVPFLGFRFRAGGAPRLLGATKRRFERRARRQAVAVADGTLPSVAALESARAWAAFAREGNVKGLFRKYREEGFGETGLWRVVAGAAGGVLEQQQSGQSPLRQPERQPSVESQQQHRVPCGVVALSAYGIEV